MRFLIHTLLMLLATLLALVAALLAARRTPPAPALLAYLTYTRETGSDVAVVWPDEPAVRYLETSPAAGLTLDDLSWSADGRWLIVSAADGMRSTIYRVRLNGSVLQPLTGSDARAHDGVTSPDGRRLAFHSNAHGSDDIFVAALDAVADSQEPRNLTRAATPDFDPVWSPDGTRIAFVRLSQAERAIYVLDVLDDGDAVTESSVEPALLVAGEAYHPAWSPGGEWIAYLGGRDQDQHIGVIRADGTGQRVLSTGLIDPGPPVWSPDGRWVAFHASANRRARTDIYAAHVGGTLAPRRLTHHVAADRAPSWSPDGAWLAFETTRGGTRDVYLVRANGSGVRPLAASRASERAPVWSPPLAMAYHPVWLYRLALGLVGIVIGPALWRARPRRVPHWLRRREPVRHLTPDDARPVSLRSVAAEGDDARTAPD